MASKYGAVQQTAILDTNRRSSLYNLSLLNVVDPINWRGLPIPNVAALRTALANWTQTATRYANRLGQDFRPTRGLVLSNTHQILDFTVTSGQSVILPISWLAGFPAALFSIRLFSPDDLPLIGWMQVIDPTGPYSTAYLSNQASLNAGVLCVSRPGSYGFLRFNVRPNGNLARTVNLRLAIAFEGETATASPTAGRPFVVPPRTTIRSTGRLYLFNPTSTSQTVRLNYQRAGLDIAVAGAIAAQAPSTAAPTTCGQVVEQDIRGLFAVAPAVEAALTPPSPDTNLFNYKIVYGSNGALVWERDTPMMAADVDAGRYRLRIYVESALYNATTHQVASNLNLNAFVTRFRQILDELTTVRSETWRPIAKPTFMIRLRAPGRLFPILGLTLPDVVLAQIIADMFTGTAQQQMLSRLQVFYGEMPDYRGYCVDVATHFAPTAAYRASPTYTGLNQTVPDPVYAGSILAHEITHVTSALDFAERMIDNGLVGLIPSQPGAEESTAHAWEYINGNGFPLPYHKVVYPTSLDQAGIIMPWVDPSADVYGSMAVRVGGGAVKAALWNMLGQRGDWREALSYIDHESYMSGDNYVNWLHVLGLERLGLSAAAMSLLVASGLDKRNLNHPLVAKAFPQWSVAGDAVGGYRPQQTLPSTAPNGYLKTGAILDTAYLGTGLLAIQGSGSYVLPPLALAVINNPSNLLVDSPVNLIGLLG